MTPFASDPNPQTWPYTCADCGKPGVANFPIDPKRPFRCKDCYRAYRDKRVADARVLKGTTIFLEDRPHRVVVYDSTWKDNTGAPKS